MQEDNAPKQPGPVATGWHCNKKRLSVRHALCERAIHFCKPNTHAHNIIFLLISSYTTDVSYPMQCTCLCFQQLHTSNLQPLSYKPRVLLHGLDSQCTFCMQILVTGGVNNTSEHAACQRQTYTEESSEYQRLKPYETTQQRLRTPQQPQSNTHNTAAHFAQASTAHTLVRKRKNLVATCYEQSSKISSANKTTETLFSIHEVLQIHCKLQIQHEISLTNTDIPLTRNLFLWCNNSFLQGKRLSRYIYSQRIPSGLIWIALAERRSARNLQSLNIWRYGLGEQS